MQGNEGAVGQRAYWGYVRDVLGSVSRTIVSSGGVINASREGTVTAQVGSGRMGDSARDEFPCTRRVDEGRPSKTFRADHGAAWTRLDVMAFRKQMTDPNPFILISSWINRTDVWIYKCMRPRSNGVLNNPLPWKVAPDRYGGTFSTRTGPLPAKS